MESYFIDITVNRGGWRAEYFSGGTIDIYYNIFFCMLKIFATF